MQPQNQYVPAGAAGAAVAAGAGIAPFEPGPRRLVTGAPLPSANLRAPYRSETKSPETSKRLDDVMLQYQQQQKMLQHKPAYYTNNTNPTGNINTSMGQLPSGSQQQNQPQQPQQLTSPTGYGDPYASHMGYTGTGGGRMLVRDNQQQQQQQLQQLQQQQLGGKYDRKRVLADEPNPIEPNIADPLFSVKRTHFHPPTTGSSSSRV